MGKIKLPKNGKPRTIIVPPPALEAVRELPRSMNEPLVFTTKRGKQFRKTSRNHYWNAVRAAWGRPEMEFYELRHACATMLLEKGFSHADVAMQLGHTDGGRLVMEVYGHPTEKGARERLKRAHGMNVAQLKKVANG